MILIQLLFACAATADLAAVRAEPPEAPAPTTVSVTAPPAYDPLGGAPLAYTVVSAPGTALVLEVLDPSGQVLEAVEGTAAEDGGWAGSWDGTGSATGAYVIRATAADSSGLETVVEHPLALVRPGFVAAWADDDNGTSALREPLFWGADRVLQDSGLPFASLETLDDADGPHDFPPVAADLLRPPDVESEPLAFTWDSRPMLTLDPGSSSVLGDPALHLVDLQLEVDGWTVLSGLPLAVGVPVVLQADAALRDGVGVVEEDLALRFVASDSAGDVWTVGEQLLPVRFYALLGPSGFSNPSPMYRPWVAVVDPALRGIDGTPADANAAVDALVEWVYSDLGLVYDTDSGASAYSLYVGSDWQQPHFYLSDFLKRKYGGVINCSDAGNILGAYANMIGAPLDHIVILDDFDLNEIKAIGQADFTSCPFGPNSCGFSYHAVTTVDGGATIWDATLALDGDLDPGATPSSELLVQSLSGEEYLDRLVRRGPAVYAYQAEETIE